MAITQFVEKLFFINKPRACIAYPDNTVKMWEGSFVGISVHHHKERLFWSINFGNQPLLVINSVVKVYLFLIDHPKSI